MSAKLIEHIGLTASNRWKQRWTRFWMRYAGLHPSGRIATACATLFAPPHKERIFLANQNKQGYISVRAKLFHSQLCLGDHVFIDDHALLFQRRSGGPMHIGNNVRVFRYNILETGHGGTLEIEDDASIHPKCQLNAYVSRIRIGSGTMLAPCCALYSYNHGVSLDRPIREQALRSRGGILIGKEVWLGYGSIVLDGVTIGDGAVIGAGSVVTQDVPAFTVAAGNPARIVKHRKEQEVNS
jgi:acetyltransferase-like isoleucine patch superfamily enzyme